MRQARLQRLQECPHCAVLIRADDLVCHHCVREIPFPVFYTEPFKRRVYPYGLAVFIIGAMAFLSVEGRAFWKALFPESTDQVALTTSFPITSAPSQESIELPPESKNGEIAEEAAPGQLKQKPTANRALPKSRAAAQRADAAR